MKSLNELKHFNFKLTDLGEVYSFNKMIKYVINNTKSELYESDLDYSSRDNFGTYSVGYRVFLKHKPSNKILYIYFGYIFNYIKQSGIFAEVDYNSNKDFFEEVCKNVDSLPNYTINRIESPFLKLFYPEDAYEKLIKEKSYEVQVTKLKEFFNACCNSFIKGL